MLVDFPSAHCRDGSSTRIGLSWIANSKKLAIFLDGDGACFSAETCAMNPSKRGAMFNGTGIFDRTNAHTWLGDPFYSTTVSATRLSDWTWDLLADTCQDIGP